jgi:exosortase
MISNSSNSREFSFFWAYVIPACLLLCSYWFVLASLAEQWVHDSNYTHGLFTLPIAILLVWRRRGVYTGIQSRPSRWGLACLFLGAALYLAGVLGAELFTARVSLPMSILGVMLAIQGGKRTRAMLFPILLLYFMIPLPYIFYYKLTFPLQIKSSQMAGAVIALLGIPAQRFGNVIKMDHYSLEVVTACSGLRSVMTLVTLALFMTEFLRIRLHRKILFIALAVPVAIFSNVIRIVVTAVIATVSGSSAADKYLHSLSGIAVFLTGLICLTLFGLVFEWMERKQRR